MAQLNEPSVCAIMLTRDRPEMARQAVACFRRQSYPNKILLVYDTGASDEAFEEFCDEQDGVFVVESKSDDHHGNRKSIGYLRNRANAAVPCDPDILIHWDDDDFSHPNRIAEQVALLQSSGADCVGYNEMLFWRETAGVRCSECGRNMHRKTSAIRIPAVYLKCECGVFRDMNVEQYHSMDSYPEWAKGPEAWLYSNPNQSYVLGTSMCYWRKAWEARPFEATSQGEDARWSAGVRCVGSQSFWPRAEAGTIAHGSDSEPRMIARIHAGNTSNAYRPETMARASEWRRVSEWDQHCRSVFA